MRGVREVRVAHAGSQVAKGREMDSQVQTVPGETATPHHVRGRAPE
jgi:hypothetical protein